MEIAVECELTTQLHRETRVSISVAASTRTQSTRIKDKHLLRMFPDAVGHIQAPVLSMGERRRLNLHAIKSPNHLGNGARLLLYILHQSWISHVIAAPRIPIHGAQHQPAAVDREREEMFIARVVNHVSNQRCCPSQPL